MKSVFLTLVATIGLSVFLSDEAAAEAVTGNDLYSACQNVDDGLSAGFCVGYLIGASDGQKWGVFVLLNRLDPIENVDDADSEIHRFLGHCVPPEASNQQLRDVVLQHLERNPASRHLPARGLVWQAYLDAFPCNE